MQTPNIGIAIPKRRYGVGHFNAIVLGDIESLDDNQYRYILAMVREGDAAPLLYVTAEKNVGSNAAQGSYRLRVVSEVLTETLDSSDDWRDLEKFTVQALSVAAQALGLTDAQPVRLM